MYIYLIIMTKQIKSIKHLKILILYFLEFMLLSLFIGREHAYDFSLNILNEYKQKYNDNLAIKWRIKTYIYIKNVLILYGIYK